VCICAAAGWEAQGPQVVRLECYTIAAERR
jgi:hypothetical protein